MEADSCKALDMACNSESTSPSEDADVLMIDPFLDYINHMLMDEGMDDAASLQHVEGGTSSYEAIFSSLQNIIADSGKSHDEDAFDPMHESIQQVDGRSAYQTIFSTLQDIIADSSFSLGQELGNGTPKLPLPSTDEEFSSEFAELDLSFEDLKVDDVYTSLYVEVCDSSTMAAGNRRHKQNSMVGKGRSCEDYTSEVGVFVDVKKVLLSCAQAVAVGDIWRANKILQELHYVYGASAHGTGMQRIAYIFSKALAARMRGTGFQEFEAMSIDMPSSADNLRATKLEFDVIPYKKLIHYFANQSILKAAEGASRLHIVDYGSSVHNGLPWPCLINALADRKGGPPLLVITGIEFPQAGIDMAEKLDESGRRLAAYAKTYNVPFQYHAIVTDKWEDLDAASLQLHSESEVIVVNCLKRLRHLADDSTALDNTVSVRQKLLSHWHSLNPNLLVTAVMNAAHNSPFFLARFCEALNFYSTAFDTLDSLWGDIPERHITEMSYYYCNMLNVVACEGAERVERPETYKRWHARIAKAGFEQLPIPPKILARSKAHVKQHYHRDFLIHDDDQKGWMLMGWKGRAMVAISAWKPSRVC